MRIASCVAFLFLPWIDTCSWNILVNVTCWKLKEYTEKRRGYVVKIKTCGPGQNSYSKTDHDAAFVRMKKDYMGNDQLLPAYNIQIGVADKYIAVAEVMQRRPDMDCFVPLMETFGGVIPFFPFPVCLFL